MIERECEREKESPTKAICTSFTGPNHVYYSSKHSGNDNEEEEEYGREEEELNKRQIRRKTKAGTVDLTPRNTVLGTLVNTRQVIVLIDSGATLSIVGHSFLHNNPNVIIGKIETLDEPITICIADSTKIPVDKRIVFEVQLGQVAIRINALILPNDIGSVEVIIGTEDLTASKASLDFSTNRITFKQGYATCMKLEATCIIPPHGIKTVLLYGKVRKPFKNKDVVLKATGFGRRILPQRSLVTMKRGRCYTILMNT